MPKPKSRAAIRRMRGCKGRQKFRPDTKLWWLEENTPARLAFRLAAMEIESALPKPDKRERAELPGIVKTAKLIVPGATN